MKKFLLTLSALSMALFFIGCSESDDPEVVTYPDAVVELTAGETTFESLSFTLETEEASEVAWTIQKSDAAALDAAAVLANGTKVEANKSLTLKAEALEAETAYTIYAAANNADKSKATLATVEMTTAAAPVVPEAVGKIEVNDENVTESVIIFTVETENVVAASYNVVATELVTDEITAEYILGEGGYPLGEEELNTTKEISHRRGVQAATEYTIFLAYKGEGEDAEAKMITATVTTPGSEAPENYVILATAVDVFADDLYGETIVTMVGEEYKLSITLNTTESIANKECWMNPEEGEIGITYAALLNLDGSEVDGVVINAGKLSVMDSVNTPGTYLVDASFMTEAGSQVAATYEGEVSGLKPAAEVQTVDFTIEKATLARSEDYADDASVWYLELTSTEGTVAGLTIDTANDQAPILITGTYPVISKVDTQNPGVDQICSWNEIGGGFSVIEGEAFNVQTMYDGENAETDKYVFSGALSTFNMISGAVEYKINFITPEGVTFALYPKEEEPDPRPVEELAFSGYKFNSGYYQKVAEGNYRFFNENLEFNVFIQGEFTSAGTEFSVEEGTLLTTSTMTVKVDGLTMPKGVYTLRSGSVKLVDKSTATASKITFSATVKDKYTVWRASTEEKHTDVTYKTTTGASCQNVDVTEAGEQTLSIASLSTVTYADENMTQLRFTLVGEEAGSVEMMVSPYTLGDGVYYFDLAGSTRERYVIAAQTFAAVDGNQKFLPDGKSSLTIEGSKYTFNALSSNGTRYKFEFDSGVTPEPEPEVPVVVNFTPTRFEPSFTEEGFQLIAEDDQLNKMTLVGSYNLGVNYFNGTFGFYASEADNIYELDWFDITKSSMFFNNANFTIKQNSTENQANMAQFNSTMPDEDKQTVQIAFLGTSIDGVERQFVLQYEGAFGYDMSAPEKPVEEAAAITVSGNYRYYTKIVDGNITNIKIDLIAYVSGGYSLAHQFDLYFKSTEVPTAYTDFTIENGLLDGERSTYTNVATGVTYKNIAKGGFAYYYNNGKLIIKGATDKPTFREETEEKYIDQPITFNQSQCTWANPEQTSTAQLEITGIDVLSEDSATNVTQISINVGGSFNLKLTPYTLEDGTYYFAYPETTHTHYANVAGMTAYIGAEGTKATLIPGDDNYLKIEGGVYTLSFLSAEGVRYEGSFTKPAEPEVETVQYDLSNPSSVSIYPSEDVAGALTLEYTVDDDFFVFTLVAPVQLSALTSEYFSGGQQVFVGTADYMSSFGVLYFDANNSYAYIDGKGYDLLSNSTDYYAYLMSSYDGVNAETDVLTYMMTIMTAGKEYNIVCSQGQYTGAHSGGGVAAEPVTIEFEPTMVVTSAYNEEGTEWKIEAMDEAGYYYSFYIKQAEAGTSIAYGYYYIGKTAPCLDADYTVVYDADYNEYYFAEGSGVALSTEWDADGNEVSTRFIGRLTSTDGMLTINIDYSGKIYNSAVGGWSK